MNDMVTVETFSAVFSGMRRHFQIPPGGTVEWILDAIGAPQILRTQTRVFINGHRLDGNWDSTIPKAGAIVNVAFIPASDNPDNVALMRTAIMAAGAFVGRMVAGEFGGIAGEFLTALAVSVLLPVPDVPAEEQSYSVSGVSNDKRPWEVVPKAHGCIRFAPPLAAEVIKRQNGILALLCAGHGPLYLSDPRIGDRDARSIEGIRIWTSTGAISPNASKPSLFNQYPNDTHTQSINRALQYAATWNDPQYKDPEGPQVEGPHVLSVRAREHPRVVRFTTQPGSVQVEIDLDFPDGLGKRQGDDANNTDMRWTAGDVTFFVQYRHHAAGNVGWIPMIPNESGIDPDVAANIERMMRFTDEEWWAIIGELTEQWLGIANDLDGISDATSGIEQSTHDMAMDRLTRLGEALNLARTPLEHGNELTPEQVAQIDTLAGILLQVSVTMGRIAIVTGEVAAGMTWVGTAITAVMGVAEIIDGAIAAERSFREGHLSDFDKLPLLTKFFVWFARRAHYFTDIPDNAFRVTNTDAKEGRYTKTLTFSGLTPGIYDVRIRRATEDSRSTPNEWFDPIDWVEWFEDVSVDACNVADVRSVALNPPVSDAAARRYAFALVAARAGDEVNGNLNAVSFLAKAPVQWHDGTKWRKWSLTDDSGRAVYRNPAWILCDVLCGSSEIADGGQTYNLNTAAAQRPVSRDKIDMDRMIEWAEYCFEKGFHFDFVYDKKTSWAQVRRDVCAAGKATLLMRDGLWSVAIDREQDMPAAIISTRNCRNFRSTKSFSPTPHGIRMKFQNEDADYQPDERIVYADGYGDPAQGLAQYDALHDGGNLFFEWPDGIPFRLNVTSVTDMETGAVYGAETFVVGTDFETGSKSFIAVLGGGTWADGERRWRVLGTFNPEEATILEAMDPVGITDPEHVFKIGRHFLACNQLRAEVFQLEMDYERLTFELGDRVDVQSDVVLWGLGSARITSILVNAFGKIVLVEVDALVSMEAGSSYQASIRDASNTVTIAPLSTITESGYVLEFASPIDPGNIAIGDLVVWGVENLVTTPCTVKEIRGDSDGGATVTLFEHAPDVHYADVSIIPEHDSRVTLPVPQSVASPASPTILSVKTDESAIVRISGALQSRIVLQLSAPDALTSAIEVQYRIDPRISGAPGASLVLAVPASSILPSWTRMAPFTSSLDLVSAAPVVDGSWYQVRVRAISATGMASDWTQLDSIYIYGKTSPPPDVLSAWYAQGCLRWEYKNAPIDHAGFLIRSIAGTGGTWESAGAAHDGIVTDTSFSLVNFAGGQRVFFIKAVDVAGNESNVAARVVVDMGDVPTDNIVLRTSHADDGWTGEKTGCEVSGGKLVASAGTKTSFYRGRGVPFYCPAPQGSGETNGEQPFYITQFKKFEYRFTVTPTADDLPYLLSVQANVEQAECWCLEYRQDDAQLWPSNVKAAFWPAKASYALWTDINAWKPFTEKIQAVAGTTYEFRIVAPASNTRMTVSDIVVLRDVEDLEEKIAAQLITAGAGEYIAYTKSFRAIVTVQATFRYDASYLDARTVEVISSDADPDGGLVIHVFDSSHVRCAGVVDITIKGY